VIAFHSCARLGSGPGRAAMGSLRSAFDAEPLFEVLESGRSSLHLEERRDG